MAFLNIKIRSYVKILIVGLFVSFAAVSIPSWTAHAEEFDISDPLNWDKMADKLKLVIRELDAAGERRVADAYSKMLLLVENVAVVIRDEASNIDQIATDQRREFFNEVWVVTNDLDELRELATNDARELVASANDLVSRIPLSSRRPMVSNIETSFAFYEEALGQQVNIEISGSLLGEGTLEWVDQTGNLINKKSMQFTNNSIIVPVLITEAHIEEQVVNFDLFHIRSRLFGLWKTRNLISSHRFHILTTPGLSYELVGSRSKSFQEQRYEHHLETFANPTTRHIARQHPKCYTPGEGWKYDTEQIEADAQWGRCRWEEWRDCRGNHENRDPVYLAENCSCFGWETLTQFYIQEDPDQICIQANLQNGENLRPAAAIIDLKFLKRREVHQEESFNYDDSVEWRGTDIDLSDQRDDGWGIEKWQVEVFRTSNPEVSWTYNNNNWRERTLAPFELRVDGDLIHISPNLPD